MKLKTQNLLPHKVVEALESVISFFVTADSILVAGNMVGYKPMVGITAGLRWASVASSCVCLPLIGLDVAKKRILTSGHDGHDYIHLINHVSNKRGQLGLFAFHASEVLGHLVFVILTFAARPHSMFISIVTCASLSLLLLALYAVRVYRTSRIEGLEVH